MTRFRAPFACTISVAILAAALACSPASAQEGRQQGGGFLDNLFSRGDGGQQRQSQDQAPPDQGQRNQVAQTDPGDLAVRLDRIEGALRQITGNMEQLQYRNQQLEMQLKRLQDDTEYRFQQMGVKGGAAPVAPGSAPPPNSVPGRRGDTFDPRQNPNAPGAPRALGNPSVAAMPAQSATDEPPIGAPGGRAAGAPLDLSTLSANPPAPPSGPVASTAPPPVNPPIMNTPPVQASQASAQPPVQAPAQPPRNVNAAGTQLATLPPSASPQDEYDLAYGYVLHKDYALAEQAFRDFLKKYPDERLVPDAQYWLGESLFQRQRYRDAAESFLAVSTKYEHAGKAPNSLLRLGQSLAAMHQKEAACATLAEVGRKFPRASAAVKRGVAQEQKRAHC